MESVHQRNTITFREHLTRGIQVISSLGRDVVAEAAVVLDTSQIVVISNQIRNDCEWHYGIVESKPCLVLATCGDVRMPACKCVGTVGSTRSVQSLSGIELSRCQSREDSVAIDIGCKSFATCCRQVRRNGRVAQKLYGLSASKGQNEWKHMVPEL